MAKLTIKDWTSRYEQTTAATQNIIVYTLEKRVYMSVLTSLEGLPMEIHSRVDARGVEYDALRLDLKQIDCLRLRDNGAALLGWAKDFFKEYDETRKDTHETRGDYVERKIIERYHGIKAKASAAYYESGDAIIAGQETQIKYSDGTLAKIDTIRKQWNKQKKKRG